MEWGGRTESDRVEIQNEKAVSIDCEIEKLIRARIFSSPESITRASLAYTDDNNGIRSAFNQILGCFVPKVYEF